MVYSFFKFFFLFPGLSTSRSTNDCKFYDLQFYSQEFLSLLIFDSQNESSYLINLTLKNTKLFNRDRENFDLNDLIDTWPRAFDGINAKQLSTSGARKVAAILSENCRKIRLLETEVELDDEEEDDDEEINDDSMMDITTASIQES